MNYLDRAFDEAVEIYFLDAVENWTAMYNISVVAAVP
jgi:hypothetical protein